MLMKKAGIITLACAGVAALVATAIRKGGN
jgi:hypothetical protein